MVSWPARKADRKRPGVPARGSSPPPVTDRELVDEDSASLFFGWDNVDARSTLSPTVPH